MYNILMTPRPKALLAAGLLLLAANARAADANVLLVTIDTLRADRLGCYGPKGGPTPVIDALAARGALFERAFAHNPTTLPSHANILSGLTPLSHGVSENAQSRFPAGLPTLAADLKARGYATGAFVGAFPLDSRFGLDRGFDVYDDAFPARPAPGGGARERRASDVVGAAVAWLDGQKGKWFCWIHLWDPHAPYAPPEPFAARFRDDPYAGEVAYVDAELGRLFAELERRGLPAGTLVVLTADHGEGLGEHGEMTHSYFAYNSTLHVPLIIAGPGVAPRRVAANVGHIDILPTVDELLGVKSRPGLQGRSLAALMRGGRGEDRPLYFESLEPYLDKGCAPLRGFIRGRRKYFDSPIPEVYDLQADFGETKNLAPDNDLGSLRRELDRIKKDLSSPRAGAGGRVADQETLERLRSLGYAASPVFQPKASYGPADDLKSVLPFQQRLERAILLADGGRAEEAIRDLGALVRDKKDFTPAYVYLSQTLVSLGRVQDAVRTLDDGVRENPASYALLSTLGMLLVMNRMDERAETVLERALAVIDFDPDAWNNLGGVLMRKGNQEGALECFERAVSLDARFIPAYLNIGLLRLNRYFGRGRDPEDLASALENLRQAVILDPGLHEALRALGSASMASGNVDEAIAAWEKAVAAEPRDDFSTYNLGLAYLRKGEKAKALRSFETYLALKKDKLTADEKNRVEELMARCRDSRGHPAAAVTERRP
jgi:arylsulfatase A-like enzyme/Flp pilus assembly protein TadD